MQQTDKKKNFIFFHFTQTFDEKALVFVELSENFDNLRHFSRHSRVFQKVF